MSATPETRWDRMRDLFGQATELPTVERIPFIARSRAETDLRAEIIALLHADECQKKKPITAAIGAELEANAEERRQRLVGSTVGDYRLLSVIGHGGTGTVYLAERLDANGDAKVAIKIVEGAATNATAKRRFSDERQILANLNHPYIARSFDAGDTTHGYPYLVMDYVDGEPIDRYCDRHRLTIRQRIELFLKVCEAVEYAHRNLVIHRDLKPQNILVTKEGIPKLLDFGIAKLLAEHGRLQELDVTRFQELILTPAYASPEQVQGKPINTATDVYTLGIVLYELLTSIKPFDQFSSTSYLEYERLISTRETESPSKAIQSISNTSLTNSYALQSIQRIATRRSTRALKLQSQLIGDIDAIVLRALRPVPTDRYGSVELLRDDLRNHLSYAPVSASKHNWLYLSQRLLRRHRSGFAAAAFAIAVLVATLIVVLHQGRQLTLQRDWAITEKQNADAVAEFMTDVFDRHDEQIGYTPTAIDLLDNATARIHDGQRFNPEVKAKLLSVIGAEQRRNGMPDKAIALLEESATIAKEQHIQGELAFQISLELAKAHIRYGNLTRAREMLLKLVSKMESRGNVNSKDYGLVIYELGGVEIHSGHYSASRPLNERALAIFRNAVGPDQPEVAMTLETLADIEEMSGNTLAQRNDLLAADAIFRKTVSEQNPDRLSLQCKLANLFLQNNKIERAAELTEAAVVTARRISPSGSERINYVLEQLISVRRAQGRLAEAELISREILQSRAARVGQSHKVYAYSRTSLAIILWQLGKLSEAEAHLRAAIDSYHQMFEADNYYTAAAEHFLAEVLLSEGRIENAATQSKITFDRLVRLQAVPWRLARTENVLGAALFAQRKFDEAQPLLEHSYEVLSTSVGPDRDTVQLAHDRLERFYVARHSQEKLAVLRAADSKRIAVSVSNGQVTKLRPNASR